MSLAVLASRALSGAHAHVVRVETHLGPGLPGFNVVGLPDAGVRESRERVRAAIINSGFEFPAGRITVNLSPADLPKESGRFDLPIALGLLLASGQLPGPPSAGDAGGKPPAMPASESILARLVLAGELSLTGALTPVTAPLLIALGVARDQPDATLVLPAGSAEQAAWVPGLRVLSARSLADVAAHITGAHALPDAVPAPWPEPPPVPCLSDVRGQPAARRALEVAAAGGHSLLMVGPPGAGKSMLAQRLPGLLPPLSRTQALEAAAVAALAGHAQAPAGQPPFRAPHHSLSVPALVGGGTHPRPGEISLAHHGVLFLDELPEFNRRTLESLREPLETGRVLISRAMRTARFPARFQLVAAMNPCPCGWRGHPARACACTPDQVARYAGRVSGPLLDRIDLHLRLPPVAPEDLDGPPGEASPAVRERVLACRGRQLERQDKPNAALAGAELDCHCALDESGRELLRQAMRRLRGSARVLHRTLRVARTIADLEGAERLGARHVAQAVQYRAE
ncbi:YifB family Mg chelatase-like AAA ATPase [Achromobacter sp. AONIH1]|uniref:YifB family Mg chelatase-like AAA ATPase n=1 Tax=Achromobacter sp. AONIH1 TaxID=1758194 RepID=UPI000CD229F9|nr:YifB family Mg chelatase-like AAA ATPase [Achromobacter sp. AONIH1]AUT47511.1 ATP-dependent protease [Achromobacter sp. AONIH1]